MSSFHRWGNMGFSDTPKVAQSVNGQKPRDPTLSPGALSVAPLSEPPVRLMWREQGCCTQSTEPKGSRKAIFRSVGL